MMKIHDDILLFNFLKEMGRSNIEIDKLNGDTRLFHDLKIYGDEVDVMLLYLVENGVDISAFIVDEFFPPEFYGSNIFEKIGFYLLPFSFFFFLKKEAYKPFTLDRLQEVLDNKNF